MEIKQLSFDTNEDVLKLLSLQIVSYQVEAKLIGFEDIPPLKDGIQSLREAKETFYGCLIEEADEQRLVGAVSFSREGTVVTICRMMVHPDYFRRGIARGLLHYLLSDQMQKGASRFLVSTGTANDPAISLYESFGFVARKVRTIGQGVTLTTFELIP